VHVYGHADDNIPFKNLTLEQKLNVFCDHLAKAARWRSIDNEPDISNQSLPRERVALFLSKVNNFTERRLSYTKRIKKSIRRNEHRN